MKDYCYTFYVFILFIGQLSFGQQMPIDFSDASENFIGYSGSSFSFRPSPTDTSNTVGQFFNDASNADQGFYLDLSRPIDLDFQNTITVSFYAFDPNVHSVTLKLENGVNPNVEVLRTITSPSQASWVNLTFDFSNALNSETQESVSASGTYNRITIIIDKGNFTPGTYLIDDIDDGSDLVAPTVDVVYDVLVWSDEFDTSGTNPINTTNWFHQTQFPFGNSWYNGEVQHYTNRLDNSFVADGDLNIVAIKEPYTDQGTTKQYTSARLNSKFAFTYGRVDVRAKLPVEAGTWPAIWLLGKNVNENGGYWNADFGNTSWPACGEIDIMEKGIFENAPDNFIQSAIHTPSSSGNTVNKGGIEAEDVENVYHVYSLNWSPDEMSFLIDDVIFYTYNPSVKNASTWPFDEDQFILLNVAMGGFAGEIDPTFNQSGMEIDYVRVYQSSPLSVPNITLNSVTLHPNPATTMVNIMSRDTIDRLELYDILGKSLVSQSRNTKSIDVSRLSKGIYVLKLYFGLESTVRKIIVN
jgi:beta-glucanase (GH16 family)